MCNRYRSLVGWVSLEVDVFGTFSVTFEGKVLYSSLINKGKSSRTGWLYWVFHTPSTLEELGSFEKLGYGINWVAHCAWWEKLGCAEGNAGTAWIPVDSTSPHHLCCSCCKCPYTIRLWLFWIERRSLFFFLNYHWHKKVHHKDFLEDSPHADTGSPVSSIIHPERLNPSNFSSGAGWTFQPSFHLFLFHLGQVYICPRLYPCLSKPSVTLLSPDDVASIITM